MNGMGVRGAGTVLRCAVLSAGVVAFASGLAGLPVQAAPSGKRLALVIANSRYEPAAPSSVGTDAKLLAEALRRDRFDVDVKEDVDGKALRDAIDAFTHKIEPGAIALLYFGGIGIQVARQTFLIPENARIWSESDVKANGVSLDAILAGMDKTGGTVKIAIIDAARRTPIERRFRAFSAGLAGVDIPAETLAMLTATPGKLVPDGNGEASLFMLALVKAMHGPALGAEDILTRTRMSVSQATHGEQVPWVASSLSEAVPFGPHANDDAPSAGERPAASGLASDSGGQGSAAGHGPAVQTSAGAPAAGTLIRDCVGCPDLIVQAAGGFTMGSASQPYERPRHHVTLPHAFAMARAPVTFGEWTLCVTEGGCAYRPNDQGWGAGDRPVINISWSDAKAYIAWLSRKAGHAYRLPSEAEWEYCAHGGTVSSFSWGSSVGVHRANCQDCDPSPANKTVPVRTYAPNGFGLFDMGGNVAQWVDDCWNDSYRGAPKDGSAWRTGQCTLRVLRGGAFSSPSAEIRPTARFRYESDVRYYANGFRVARDIP